MFQQIMASESALSLREPSSPSNIESVSTVCSQPACGVSMSHARASVSSRGRTNDLNMPIQRTSDVTVDGPLGGTLGRVRDGRTSDVTIISTRNRTCDGGSLRRMNQGNNVCLQSFRNPRVHQSTSHSSTGPTRASSNLSSSLSQQGSLDKK